MKMFADEFPHAKGIWGTPGWMKLPSGIIVQWGTAAGPVDQFSAFTLTFPIVFPTAVMYASATSGDHGAVDGAVSNVNGFPSVAQARYVLYSRAGASYGSGYTVRINWLAIGY